MSRRAPREEPSATFAALSPIYWTLGPLLRGLMFVIVGCLFLIFGAPHDSLNWTGIAGLVATAVLTALAFVGSKVVLAEGGVWIRHYGGIFKRFIPYSEISFVETTQRLGKPFRWQNVTPDNQWNLFHGVRLQLKSGKRVVVGTAIERTELDSPPGNWFMGEYGRYGRANPTAQELLGEIRTRIRAEEELPVPTPEEEALMRGDRTVAEWHTALRQRVPDATDAYRGAGTTEPLWRVVEDEDAPRDARAGAAIALRDQLDADGRARLRVVVESCESPKLRVALDAALDEKAEEESVLAALERVSNRQE